MEINIETIRVFVAGVGNGQPRTGCGRCGERARMVTVDEAAVVAGMSPAAVSRWIEAGGIHSGETLEGLQLVCLNSLLESV